MELNRIGRGIAGVLILSFPLNLYASGLEDAPPSYAHRCENLAPKKIEQKSYDPNADRSRARPSSPSLITLMRRHLRPL